MEDELILDPEDLQELEDDFRSYLVKLPLPTLRLLGRDQGTPAAASESKTKVIVALLDIMMGRKEPVVRSKRGAPVKQNYLDPSVIPKLNEIREKFMSEKRRQKGLPEVSKKTDEAQSTTSINPRPTVYSGTLEIVSGGFGFLRGDNYQVRNGGDVFISAPMIHQLKLKEGDFVTCTVKPKLKNESAAIDEVYSVNGILYKQFDRKLSFESLTACFPNQKINLSENGGISLRMIDLFAPIGKGQRALIIAPPKAGKTTLLKDIASAISMQKGMTVIVLLIDERPEEVTDFKQSVPKAEVISSTFDESAEHHIRAAELTISHAKRLAEQKQDVVVLLDSLTKLTRAYNYVSEPSGKTLTGGLDANAFPLAKQFFGAARNTIEGGSVTILATALVETGSRMDDIIFEEFKGTGNCDIFLTRELAERRVFPALDIRRSGTRKEELLLSKEELNAVYKLRENGLVDKTEGLIDMMKKTENNEQFVSRLADWLRVYRTK